MNKEQNQHLLESLNLPEGVRDLSSVELERLCEEIRELLISTVSRSGGHLASSLGVVELTVALHALLESPKDKIVWDVGHQSYVHKILTGRKDKLGTIRQFGGISGFPKRDESDHDIFGVGHASTSISAALGIAQARDINNDDYCVFSVIGDGSMSGGIAFEAINNVPNDLKKFVVILNDNGMSISSPVGALSNVITTVRTSSTYLNIKNKVESIINRVPKIGGSLTRKIEKLVDRTKNIIIDYKVGVLFEELGFRYIGPIDGHDLPMLMTAVSYAKVSDKPVMIHIVTKKGKGYLPAENDPVKFHGISPFNVESGKIEKMNTNPSYTAVFGDTLCDIAEKDPLVCAITAAMPGGTGLSQFAKNFPDRFFDVGIAEEHAVTFAAGLATQGIKPFVAIYSSFMQRAYDQVIHDICLQKLPVKIMMDRAGIVGEDGPTHHGVFDYSFMRHIPNLVVAAPKDQNELVDMIYLANEYDGPISVRYPRGAGVNEDIKTSPELMPIGESEIMFESKEGSGTKVCIVAIGNMVWPSYEVAQKLSFGKHQVCLINARFVKPLDKEMIIEKCKNADLVVTIEDGIKQGGFGSSVLELLNDNKLQVRVLNIGYEDKFIEHGDKESLLRKNNMDPSGILHQINESLKVDLNDKCMCM